jgi:hypothetical protein
MWKGSRCRKNRTIEQTAESGLRSNPRKNAHAPEPAQAVNQGLQSDGLK